MDSRTYFNSIAKLEKEYKDSIEVFKFDLIPGRDQIKKDVKIKSSTKALGAYLFAKYSGPGNFAENVGSAAILVVKCLPNKIEMVSGEALKQLLNPVHK